MNYAAKRTILIVLLLMGWQCSYAAQQYTCRDTGNHTLERTRDNRPHWDDLGMENVLAVGQPTVVAPTVVRVVHENVSPLSRGTGMSRRTFRSSPVDVDIPHCAQPDYLYLLLCLRL